MFEHARNPRSDLSDALDDNMPAGQTGVSEGALRDRAQTVPNSVSRHRRRVARPAGGSRDVPRGLGDDVEVLHGRPDVGRRDVPAAEPLDLTTVRAHQRVGLVSSSIPDDHCFAAPKRKIRAGGLVRHRLPETESVGQRFVLVRVRPHPRPAERRPARGRVHRDDHSQPGAGIVAEDDLLVLGPQPVEDGHAAIVLRGFKGRGWSFVTTQEPLPHAFSVNDRAAIRGSLTAVLSRRRWEDVPGKRMPLFGQVGEKTCRLSVNRAERRPRAKCADWTRWVVRKPSQRAIGGEGVQDRC